MYPSPPVQTQSRSCARHQFWVNGAQGEATTTTSSPAPSRASATRSIIGRPAQSASGFSPGPKRAPRPPARIRPSMLRAPPAGGGSRRACARRPARLRAGRTKRSRARGCGGAQVRRRARVTGTGLSAQMKFAEAGIGSKPRSARSVASRSRSARILRRDSSRAGYSRRAASANASAKALTDQGARHRSHRSTRSGSPKPKPRRSPGTANAFVMERSTKTRSSSAPIIEADGSASSINASSTKKRVVTGVAARSSSTATRPRRSPVGLFGLQRKRAAAPSTSPVVFAPASSAANRYSPKVGRSMQTRSPGSERGQTEGPDHLDRAVPDRDLLRTAAEGPADRLPERGIPVVRVVLEAGGLGSPVDARREGVEVGREVEPAALVLLLPREPAVVSPLRDRSLHCIEYLSVIGDAGLRGVWSASGL